MSHDNVNPIFQPLLAAIFPPQPAPLSTGPLEPSQLVGPMTLEQAQQFERNNRIRDAGGGASAKAPASERDDSRVTRTSPELSLTAGPAGTSSQGNNIVDDEDAFEQLAPCVLTANESY